MEIYSKYLKGYVAAEEDRIRREIVAKLFSTFKGAGFCVSVSHDSANETEKKVHGTSDCLSAVFESEYDAGRCWIFATKPEMEKPFWVLLVTENVEDIISDYAVSSEKFVAPANKLAEKYQ